MYSSGKRSRPASAGAYSAGGARRRPVVAAAAGSRQQHAGATTTSDPFRFSPCSRIRPQPHRGAAQVEEIAIAAGHAGHRSVPVPGSPGTVEDTVTVTGTATGVFTSSASASATAGSFEGGGADEDATSAAASSVPTRPRSANSTAARRNAALAARARSREARSGSSPRAVLAAIEQEVALTAQIEAAQAAREQERRDSETQRLSRLSHRRRSSHRSRSRGDGDGCDTGRRSGGNGGARRHSTGRGSDYSSPDGSPTLTCRDTHAFFADSLRGADDGHTGKGIHGRGAMDFTLTGGNTAVNTAVVPDSMAKIRGIGGAPGGVPGAQLHNPTQHPVQKRHRPTSAALRRARLRRAAQAAHFSGALQQQMQRMQAEIDVCDGGYGGERVRTMSQSSSNPWINENSQSGEKSQSRDSKERDESRGVAVGSASREAVAAAALPGHADLLLAEERTRGIAAAAALLQQTPDRSAGAYARAQHARQHSDHDILEHPSPAPVPEMESNRSQRGDQQDEHQYHDIDGQQGEPLARAAYPIQELEQHLQQHLGEENLRGSNAEYLHAVAAGAGTASTMPVVPPAPEPTPVTVGGSSAGGLLRANSPDLRPAMLPSPQTAEPGIPVVRESAATRPSEATTILHQHQHGHAAPAHQPDEFGDTPDEFGGPHQVHPSFPGQVPAPAAPDANSRFGTFDFDEGTGLGVGVPGGGLGNNSSILSVKQASGQTQPQPQTQTLSRTQTSNNSNLLTLNMNFQNTFPQRQPSQAQTQPQAPHQPLQTVESNVTLRSSALPGVPSGGVASVPHSNTTAGPPVGPPTVAATGVVSANTQTGTTSATSPGVPSEELEVPLQNQNQNQAQTKLLLLRGGAMAGRVQMPQMPLFASNLAKAVTGLPMPAGVQAQAQPHTFRFNTGGTVSPPGAKAQQGTPNTNRPLVQVQTHSVQRASTATAPRGAAVPQFGASTKLTPPIMGGSAAAFRSVVGRAHSGIASPIIPFPGRTNPHRLGMPGLPSVTSQQSRSQSQSRTGSSSNTSPVVQVHSQTSSASRPSSTVTSNSQGVSIQLPQSAVAAPGPSGAVPAPPQSGVQRMATAAPLMAARPVVQYVNAKNSPMTVGSGTSASASATGSQMQSQATPQTAGQSVAGEAGHGHPGVSQQAPLHTLLRSPPTVGGAHLQSGGLPSGSLFQFKAPGTVGVTLDQSSKIAL